MIYSTQSERIIILDPNAMVVYSKQYANLFTCLLWAVVAVWPNIVAIIDQPRDPGLTATNPGIPVLENTPRRGCQAYKSHEYPEY